MYILENLKKTLISLDYFILIVVFALCLFGIIVIGSVTNVNINPNNSLQAQQQFNVATGFIIFFIVSFIDYKFIAKFFWLIYIFNILLLLSVMLFGHQTGTGVTRGLSISIGGARFGIQASQYAKLFMIIFLAGFIEKYKEKINNGFTLLSLVTLIAFPVFLVYRQPSLSASMVVLLISLTMLFLGGISYKYVITLISAVVPAGVLIFLDVANGPGNHFFIHNFLGAFQIQRLYDFFADSSHFQTQQSVSSLGSGQLTGHGLYNGIINQTNTLPEAHNDFIFAVIGEEFGFIGANIVLFVIFLLIIKCLLIAHFADTFVGKLIAAGVCAMLFFQTFVHVGVVTDILPNTGITLPFISYGGSSMWALMAAMGIVMNIHINKARPIFEDI
ncbi:MAG: FtsW/RodA/SpoVE family cell cycle protein [Defluviitaleaceae bacterium]|nr:FtsW/RodA/SpoVE family cell cycle protein [Defluviitaleaceae bacterium]